MRWPAPAPETPKTPGEPRFRHNSLQRIVARVTDNPGYVPAPRAYGKWCSVKLSYRHPPPDVLISDIAIATKAGRGESLWGRRAVRLRDRQSMVKA